MPAGSQHAIAVTLSKTNAGDIDKAISTLNTKLQADPNMKHIVAVKELNKAGTAEGIRFVSSDTSFNVKIGAATNYTTANPVGLYDGTAGAANPQGLSIDSSQSGTLDITTMDGAAQAVIALGAGRRQAGYRPGRNRQGPEPVGLRDQPGEFADQQLLLRAGTDSRCGRGDGSGESEQGPGIAAGFDCCHGPGQFRSSGSAVTT